MDKMARPADDSILSFERGRRRHQLVEQGMSPTEAERALQSEESSRQAREEH